MIVDLQKDQAQKEGDQYPTQQGYEGCVHPYILQWSGKCEACRKTPLSPNLPDPHNPNRRESREDAT